MSTYYTSKSCVWIIVIGGYREYDRSNNTDLLITGCDVTVIIELGMFIITHNLSCDVLLCMLMTVMNLINNNINS